MPKWCCNKYKKAKIKQLASVLYWDCCVMCHLDGAETQRV